jgi:NodT family efflux transporter outer membrane factor (OMF) lipoprotein
MTRSIAPSLLMLLALGGCVVGPNYQPPDSKAPASWSAAPATPEAPDALRAFWRDFDDPVLARLIQQAIDGNLDLQVAARRIRAAQDAVRVAASAGLPQVGVGAAVEDRRQSQTLDWPPDDPLYGEYPFYSLGFNASWELDLFGGIKRRKESARAAAAGAVEARRGVLVSLTAAVASDYAAFRAAEARVRIAQDALQTAKQAQALAHHAYAAGERSHLDVSEADALVDGISAAIPPLQAQSDNLIHAMAILLGEAPAQFDRAALQGAEAVPSAPALPASLPSEVIARRPDIREAERDYAEANAEVGVSIAAMYPHFSIPLSLGPSTSHLHEIFDGASLLWQVGLEASQPLYTGGRLSANVDAARTGKDAALLSYRQTVLKAFAEVEDALTIRASEQARYRSISAQVVDNRQAVSEAQERYRRGEVGFLPLLDSQEQLLAAEDAQVESSLENCLAAISLYKAIGGGWEGVTLPDYAPQPAKVARQ